MDIVDMRCRELAVSMASLAARFAIVRLTFRALRFPGCCEKLLFQRRRNPEPGFGTQSTHGLPQRRKRPFPLCSKKYAQDPYDGQRERTSDAASFALIQQEQTCLSLQCQYDGFRFSCV